MGSCSTVVRQFLLLTSLAFASSQIINTTISLSDGGQILGKRLKVQNIDVDLFHDIPYAKPPIGPLRFKKPEPADAWSGVRDARFPLFKICTQPGGVGPGQVTGSEDCLYLDISVPGGVSANNKKSVMVWIHGGGYISGNKDIYPGVALAALGDVIVVGINYRLGALGFLSEGKGTGNYGLWDQRQALLWIKENIAVFGGDPESVTIFGESAGAGSVSAQTLGRYSEGLFKRGIQQSGALFDDWGWHLSENIIAENNELLKQSLNCSLADSVYQCTSGLSGEDVCNAVASIDKIAFSSIPTADADFFPDDITKQSYLLSQRFDEMIGYNKDEGFIFIPAMNLLFPPDGPVDDGYSLAHTRVLLEDTLCPMITPLSVELCSDYIINLYKLEMMTDKERALAYAQLRTDISLGAGGVNQLIEHGKSKKRSTYAYYLTEEFTPPIEYSPQPAWAPKRRADHGDDLPFVFGGVYLKKHFQDLYGEDVVSNSSNPLTVWLSVLYNGTTDSDKTLTDTIITMWSNFAKTGNPNLPTPIGSGLVWPQFDESNNMFMELNSENLTVISTPRKDKMDAIIEDLYTARQMQLVADGPPKIVTENCQKQQTMKPRINLTPTSGSEKTSAALSLLSLSALLCLLHI